MTLDIPPYFFDIPYKGSCYPGSPKLGDFRVGANCQVFVYQLLLHFGRPLLPDFRSSELWEDSIYTQQTTGIQPLDILFWNKTATAWGAHVGLALDNGQVIHLSRENGRAVIWPLEKFLEQDNYTVFIGAKRLLSS
ncbi:MAG: NlpC/P60 family protein [Aureispira sp.]